MRLYFFNLFHLSSIQQGIQAGHAAVELMVKYSTAGTGASNGGKPEQVLDWAQTHKTFIVLNGGMYDNMRTLQEMLSSSDNPFPWAEFTEPDMGGTLTSLCVVLPERYYAKKEPYKSLWEFQFAALLERCQLAR